MEETALSVLLSLFLSSPLLFLALFPSLFLAVVSQHSTGE